MWTCYVIALIPVFVGAVLWVSSRRITFGEWFRGSLIGLLVAGGFHFYVLKFPALDAYMQSGPVINAVHRPDRQDRRRKEDDEVQKYPEAWYVTVAIRGGNERFAIGQDEFEEIRKKFGATELTVVPVEGEFVGDSNNYVAENHNDVFIPAYTLRPFQNRAKVDPGIRSFGEAPAGTTLFAHPTEVPKSTLLAYFTVQFAATANPSECIPGELQFFDWRESKRLLGKAASDYSTEEWDRLNAELSPDKNVNLILIGFEGDSVLAHWQEAKWSGGKKNDLVLCYGSSADSTKPEWTYCFGRTEDELVKRNLESLLLNNEPGDALLPGIKDEVMAHYAPRELPALGYFEVPPPRSAIPTLIVIMVLVQGGYWLRAYTNRSRRAAVGEAERREVADEEARAWIKNRDAAERERIAGKLAHLKDPTDPDELTREVLEGKEPYVACLALRRCESPTAVTGLIVAMSSENEDARELAADWLDDHAPPPSACPEAGAAVPVLIERLAHPHPNVRKDTRSLLERIAPDWPQTPAASRDLDSMLEAIRAGTATDAVIDAIGARGEAVVDSLKAMCDEAEPATRIAAIKALGRTGSNRAARTLLDFLNSEDPALRDAAIDGFAAFGPTLRTAAKEPSVYESLNTAFKSAEEEVQLRLMDAFGWLGDERAIDSIAAFLKDRDWSLRAAAALALGQIGSSRALPLLVACADENEDAAALVAIGAIGDAATAERLLALLNSHPDTGARFAEAGIRVLARSGFPAARQFIEKVAADHTHIANELAILFAIRFRRGRPEAEWSRNCRPRI